VNGKMCQFIFQVTFLIVHITFLMHQNIYYFTLKFFWFVPPNNMSGILYKNKFSL